VHEESFEVVLIGTIDGNLSIIITKQMNNHFRTKGNVNLIYVPFLNIIYAMLFFF